MVTYTVLCSNQEFASIRLSPNFMGVMARCSNPPGFPKDVEFGVEYPVDARTLLSQVNLFIGEIKGFGTIHYSFERGRGRWRGTFSGGSVKIEGEMYVLWGDETCCVIRDPRTGETLDISGLTEFSDDDGVIRIIKRSSQKHPEVREFKGLGKKLQTIDPGTPLIVLLA